jgi:large repetitive protein
MRIFLRQKFPFVLSLIVGLGFMLGMSTAAQAQIVLDDNKTSITRGTVYNNLPFLTATGGTAPYSFYYVSGPLPSGIVINTDGTLSGKTCGANGKQTFDAKAIDGALLDSGPQAVAIVVNANNTNCGVTITPATVPRGQISRAYTTTTLTSTGGTAPYSYTVVSGTLPPGITLSLGGVLSGTPSSAGTYTATINSQGASGAGVITYTFTIDPAITLSPTTLPNGSTGTAYSQSLSASGTTSPYTFSLASGTLPTGLSLSGAGVISGTPSALGTFNFTVRATDPNSSIGNQAYTVVITGPPLTVSPPTLANGKELLSYSQTITASGGTAPYTFTVSAGALPSGLSLASGGALTGTPTAGSAGTYNFTVTANDSASSTGSRPYTIIIAAAPTITVSPATLPNGKVGLAYSQTVSASGGTAPYTFSVSAGSLPSGLALSGAGSLSGTPTAAGTYNFTVLATDTEGYTAALPYSVVVDPAPSITLAPASVPNGKELLAYSQSITASGGTAPYAYAVTAGTLPTGVTLSGAGLLSGTPASGTAGAYPFTVTATDNEGYTGAQAYTLTINAAPTITLAPLSLTNGQVGMPFSQAITASNGTAPYTYAVSAGSLPSGTSLSGAGALSGTPTAAGTFNFTVSATDNEGFTGALAYTWIINPAPTITVSPATLPNGRENGSLSVVFYNQTISASGGTAPYVYALTSGTLPAGLSLSSAGVLSGYATPGSDGNYSFEVTATDDDGYTGARTYALTIDPAPTITVSPATLSNGKVGLAYSQTITASGGTAPYTYSETGGSLPPGVTLSSGGLLSGTPTAAGTYTFTIATSDADSYFGTQNYSWVIDPAPTVTIAPSTLPTGKENLVYAPQTLTAAGGTAPYTFSITSGSLPAGLTLSGGGVVSGTPTEDGSFNFTVEATDDEGFTGTQSVSLSVTAQPTINIAPTGLSNGKVGLAYTVTLTATGGTAPHTFSVSTGTLPPGLSLSGAGVLSGTPTNAGSWGFNVTATDADGYTAVRNYDLTINSAPTITVSPTSLTAANQNLAYSATITAAGGTALIVMP